MKATDILDTLPIGLVVLDRSYRVQSWNHWMTIHSGIQPNTILNHSVFNYYPGLNKPSFIRACKTVLTFGNVVYLSQKLHRYLFPFKLPGGDETDCEYMQQSCTMSPIHSEDGSINQVAIAVHDVTDAVRMERRLRRVNNLDDLTGAFNRRYLDQRLQEEFDRHRRYGRDLSMCIFDLDHFKDTNDSIGHLAGDHALIEVRKRVTTHLRDIDVLARFGGEEFVCILPETSLSDALQVSERLRASIEETELHWKTQQFKITASFGVATLSPEMLEARDMLEAADKALYKAKEKRNCVVSSAELSGTQASPFEQAPRPQVTL